MPIDPLPLKGQSAIVTGSSTGLGAAVVSELAARGARVVVNYRSSEDEAEAVAKRIRDGGGEAIAVQADVSTEADVTRLFDACDEAYGRVDIVVANAGLQRDAAFADMTLEQWNTVMEVNLGGQFLCLREAVRRFRAQPGSEVSRARGKIVCMSSVHEIVPWAGHVNYAASKGGVMLLMKSVAQEVSGERIRVNSIAPGAIATDINEDARRTPEARKKLLTLIPYARVGETEDVARAAAWLASDDSDYVVGTTLLVDGGMSLYPSFTDNG